MKSHLIALCLGLCAMSSMAQTRIMVISDPHIVSEKNQATVTCQSGELDSHSYDILKKATENVIAAKPDLLLVCGDITYNGEKSSHEAAHALLQNVVKAGIAVKVIPGNHDILNINSIDANAANITAADFASTYSDMGYEADVARDANSLSWAASINDKLAIIGLDANIYDGKSYYSDGCLRTSTLNWMKNQAAAFQKEGKTVIAMVHQEIMNHFSRTVKYMGIPFTVTQAQVAPNKILNINYKHNPTVTSGDDVADVDTTALHKAFADAGIKYVLTGHFHVQNIASKNVTKTDGTAAKLYDISTGGLSTYPCWMRTVLVNNDDVTTTSTLLEMSVSDSQDLQDATKAETTKLDAQYPALTQAGYSVSSLIEAQMVLEPYELYDAMEVTHAGTFPTLTYTRIYSDDNWHPLFVPIAMNHDDWSENFDIATFAKEEGSSLYFNTVKEGESIAENTLAIIKLKSDKAAGRYSIASSAKTDGYVVITPAASDSKTFTEEDLNSHSIIIDGTVLPTAISTVDASATAASGKVYSINGIEMKNSKNLPHGLYIMNGKAVIK